MPNFPMKHTKQSTKITATENLEEGQMAQGAYGYNPLYQKRVTLGPDRTPGGGYHYYGPPPDAGTSYGSWFDQANQVGAIAPIHEDGVMMYSPLSGDEMQYEGPATPDMRDAVFSYAGEFHLMPASRSGHTCLTSADIYGAICPAMFNPFTGEDCTEEYQAMSNQKKSTTKKTIAASGSDSAQKQYKPASIEKPEIKNSGLPKLDMSKPPDHSAADSAKDGLNPATNSHGSDEPKKSMKTVKRSSMKPAGSEIGSNKSVEAMSDDELVAALEAHLAKADGEESSAPKLEVEINDEESAPPPPPPAAEDDESAPPPPPPPASYESESAPKSAPAPVSDPEATSSEELDIPVLEVDDEEEMASEDMMKMDDEDSHMPMANAALVKKLRATAAALRAGVKIDQREQDALVAKAIKVIRANKSDDMFVAPAIVGSGTDKAVMSVLRQLTSTVADLSKKVSVLASKKVTAAEDDAASDEKKVEEIMNSEDDEVKPDAEGTHFEVLQSLDALEGEGITAASIQCSLFAEGGINPFWNVTVHGEPLARIYLQDQDRPDEIKATFTSPQYGEAIAKASEQIEGGLRRLLADANARFFTLQLDRVEVAQKARQAALAEAKKVVAEKLSTLSDSFLERLATAAIGFDRNFFKGGNPLKHALAEQLQANGIPLLQAVRVIEAAFADGSAEYFKTLASKANELMAMEPAAFEQLRSAIIDAGTVMPVLEDDQSSDTGKSFAQHLAEQSQALAGVDAGTLGGEKLSEKEQLRRDLGFRR